MVSGGCGRGRGRPGWEVGRRVPSDSSLLGLDSRTGVVVVVVDGLPALWCGCYWWIQMSEFVWGADKHDSVSKCRVGVGLTCWPDEVPMRSVLSQPLMGDPRGLLPSITLLSLSHIHTVSWWTIQSIFPPLIQTSSSPWWQFTENWWFVVLWLACQCRAES